MKKVFETFLIIFFFCHGAASIFLISIIGDMATAYYTSMILSAVAGLVALLIDYIKHLREKPHSLDSVIDDVMLERNKEFKKKEKEAAETN